MAAYLRVPLLLSLLWVASCQVAPRDPAPASSVSPPVRAAVTHLTAEDPDVRAASLHTLAAALNQSAGEVAYVMEVSHLIQRNIALHLRTLASVKNLEARTRVLHVLQFNEALSRFVVDSADLPADRRQKLLDWALRDANIQFLAQAYSPDSDQRTQAARDLKPLREPAADELLARLIDDLDREVSLTAMDSAGDHPASAPLVDALWKKAVDYPMICFGGGFALNWDGQKKRYTRGASSQRSAYVYVRGRQFQIYPYNETSLRAADMQTAGEVLMAYDSPLVGERLEALFQYLLDSSPDSNNYQYRILSPDYGSMGTFLVSLAETYKSQNFVPCVVALALGSPQDSSNATINNQPFRTSSRIDALGLLVTVTNQDPEDYKLTRLPQWSNRWGVAGEEKDEDAQIKKVRVWWKKNYHVYGYKNASLPISASNRESPAEP